VSRFKLGTKGFRTPRSYGEWREMLLDNRAATSSENDPRFGGPVAVALRKRWDWLEESQRLAIPYREAADAFENAAHRASYESDEVERKAEAARASTMVPQAKGSRRPAADAFE
jgi:hypothetical protein